VNELRPAHKRSTERWRIIGAAPWLAVAALGLGFLVWLILQPVFQAVPVLWAATIVAFPALVGGVFLRAQSRRVARANAFVALSGGLVLLALLFWMWPWPVVVAWVVGLLASIYALIRARM
jgi:hypothetical protein